MDGESGERCSVSIQLPSAGMPQGAAWRSTPLGPCNPMGVRTLSPTFRSEVLLRMPLTVSVIGAGRPSVRFTLNSAASCLSQAPYLITEVLSIQQGRVSQVEEAQQKAAAKTWFGGRRGVKMLAATPITYAPIRLIGAHPSLNALFPSTGCTSGVDCGSRSALRHSLGSSS